MKRANIGASAVFFVLLYLFNMVEAAEFKASGSVVITHQTTNEAHINNETEASADLILSRQDKAGEWLAHFEGGTTIDDMGVAGILPEANGDAGTALDKDSDGRIQLSELYYRYSFNTDRIITAGLLDVSGFFEQSRIASDEATQFMGVFFTGNPTIEFPDYTIAAVYEHRSPEELVLRAAITSSNGLADNSARSYSQLLSVDEDGKGVFAIASASWNTDAYLLRVGAWTNTADHLAIDGSGRGHSNYGAYVLGGYGYDRHAWNMRIGFANEEVSRAARFTSLGYQYKNANYILGAGAARAYLSPEDAIGAGNDTRQYEIYIRYAVTPDVFITGDVQRVGNSDFGAMEKLRSKFVTVYGLRFSLIFE